MQRQHQAFEGAGQDHDLVTFFLVLPEAGLTYGAQPGFNEFLVTVPSLAFKAGCGQTAQVRFITESILMVQGQFFEERKGLQRGDHPAPKEKGEEESFGGEGDQGPVHVKDGGDGSHVGF
jgi:hypothetical protein